MKTIGYIHEVTDHQTLQRVKAHIIAKLMNEDENDKKESPKSSSLNVRANRYKMNLGLAFTLMVFEKNSGVVFKISKKTKSFGGRRASVEFVKDHRGDVFRNDRIYEEYGETPKSK